MVITVTICGHYVITVAMIVVITIDNTVFIIVVITVVFYCGHFNQFSKLFLTIDKAKGCISKRKLSNV